MNVAFGIEEYGVEEPHLYPATVSEGQRCVIFHRIYMSEGESIVQSEIPASIFFFFLIQFIPVRAVPYVG